MHPFSSTMCAQAKIGRIERLCFSVDYLLHSPYFPLRYFKNIVTMTDRIEHVESFIPGPIFAVNY